MVVGQSGSTCALLALTREEFGAVRVQTNAFRVRLVGRLADCAPRKDSHCAVDIHAPAFLQSESLGALNAVGAIG